MKTELSIRVKTATILVLIMLAFLIPGFWLPFIPMIAFFILAYLSSVEKARAIRRRMPGLMILEPALATIASVIIMLFFIPRGWFVHGIPEGSELLASTFVAPQLISVFAFILLALVCIWILIAALRKGGNHFHFSVFETFVIISTSVPLAAIVVLLYAVPQGYLWFLLAILTPCVSDTVSYFAGSRFGHRKLAPKLSPKKTWEGTLAGIIATWVLYCLYFPLLLGKRIGFTTGSSIALAIILGLIMSLISTAGDLYASALKRWCRIKDFSNILPGHGGISDRFDSMAWTSPTILIIALIINRIIL